MLTVLLLPFTTYAVSPAGQVFHLTCVATSALALFLVQRKEVPGFVMDITPERPNQRDIEHARDPIVCSVRVDLLALVCNSLSWIYNFHIPHPLLDLEKIFTWLGQAFGVNDDTTELMHWFFTLGFRGVEVPAYIPASLHKHGQGFGAVVFTVLWLVIPVCYVLYFVVLSKTGKGSPCIWIQQCLCGVGVLHFLFLTDLVDYRYGRGLRTEYGEVGHYTERFSWRVAMFMPLFQKLTTGAWLSPNTPGGMMGRVVYTGVSTFCLVFSVCVLIMIDGHRLLGLVAGPAYGHPRVFLPFYYHALLVSVVMYVVLLCCVPGPYVVVRADMGQPPAE